MKKIIVTLLALNLAVAGFSQSFSLKKRPSIGVNLFLKDFGTPDAISKTSLGTVLKDGTWSKIGNMNPGLGLQFMNGITNHIDYSINLNGSFLDYPFHNGTKLGKQKFLLEATGGLNFKLLTDRYFLVPYLTGNVGVSMYDASYFGVFFPVGIGFQFRLSEGNFINLQWLYNLRATENTTNHFQYSIGFVGALNPPKAKVIAEPPPPFVAVVAPPVEKALVVEKDTDGDGIVDSKDKCPTVPGVAKYDGCPIPDTDGDGINDEEDKCPTVPGVARYHGCPIPDSDGDGINDEEDRCPHEKGTVANHGCPELKQFNFNYRNIQFVTGSAKLTPAAAKELDKLTGILNEHNTLNISIDGYTDNTGKAASNLTLSQKRAAAVKDYLVKKGIDAARLTAQGYGQEHPVADNKTAQGRAQNRRVEFNVQK